jgi:hypothetical protein
VAQLCQTLTSDSDSPVGPPYSSICPGLSLEQETIGSRPLDKSSDVGPHLVN